MDRYQHDWKFKHYHPHTRKYWYECSKCGATDWIFSYGALGQLLPEDCKKPEENNTMKIDFIGTVTEKELRLMFDLTADSTPETETPEEKDKRFNSILLDWHQEVTKV